MRLSREDGNLFYTIFLPLLEYVNNKYKVNKNLKSIVTAGSLNPSDVKPIANRVWENVSIIEEYINATPVLNEEEKFILRSWKRQITGKFILERHLKTGSILLSCEDDRVFHVSGIFSSWEEMFPSHFLPVIMEATLLPFKDVIISDGLVMPYNVEVGRNMTKSFKEIYMSAKKNNRINKSL